MVYLMTRSRIRPPASLTSRCQSESGEGKLGCIFWLLVFAAVFMFGWKTIPLKMDTSRLEDFMIEQTKFAARSSEVKITTRVLNKATSLGLPVTRKDIKVHKTGARVEIHCTFTVPVEFPAYTWDWGFDLDVDRAIYQW